MRNVNHLTACHSKELPEARTRQSRLNFCLSRLLLSTMYVGMHAIRVYHIAARLAFAPCYIWVDELVDRGIERSWEVDNDPQSIKVSACAKCSCLGGLKAPSLKSSMIKRPGVVCGVGFCHKHTRTHTHTHTHTHLSLIHI